MQDSALTTSAPHGPEVVIQRVLRFSDNTCTSQTCQKYRGSVALTDKVSCSVSATLGGDSGGT